MTIDLTCHRSVHFIGIGGIGMSALARFLLARGYSVSGSDRSPGEQGAELSRLGARIHSGHAPENIRGADLVVVSSAIAPDNRELVAARDSGLPVVKRAEVLAAIANAATGVAVAGTHGKTTTSALIGHILVEAGRDPTILIGGVSANLGSNARAGNGPLVIVEADEYDASFLHLRPTVGIILNVEPDHLDFYRSIDRLHEAFREFARSVQGTLVVCADDTVLRFLVGGMDANVITYGIDSGEWRAVDIDEKDDRTVFTVQHRDAEFTVEMILAGAHNVRNALAAAAVADSLGVPSDVIAGAVAGFRGVKRRLEITGEAAGILVVDDYAHHPTEIQVNLAALKHRYRRPVRAIFQPHTFSRTRDLMAEFAGSFAEADAVYLLDIYPARETDTLGISGLTLARATSDRHPCVHYTKTADRTVDLVLREARNGDVIVTMGAGDVYLLGPQILSALGGSAGLPLFAGRGPSHE